MLYVEIHWPPCSANHQHGRRGTRTYLRPEVVDWRMKVAMRVVAAAIERGEALPYLRCVSLEMRMMPPDQRKRDSDNIEKMVRDALQAAGVVVDDSQFVTTWKSIYDPAKHPDAKHGVIRVCVDECERETEW